MRNLFNIIILCSLLSIVYCNNIPIIDKFDVPHYNENDVPNDDLTVTISTGTLRGTYDERKRSRNFRAIPYGTPPVGKLRWTNAVPAQSWSGVRDATQQPPGCIQFCDEPPIACPKVISEDCLYLNVYTPAVMPAKPMPVMLFIHGGNFRDGYCGTPLYDGSYIANTTETIMVVTNYRLAVLGWLADSEKTLNGNYGFSDQQMALKWIQKNIAAFGGDPNQVTLFGQSAGAVSTAVHMYAPSSEGLFHQALLESEPYGIPLRRPDDMYALEEAFASFMGCKSGDVACYNTKNSSQILAGTVKIYGDIKIDKKFLQAFMPLTPTVDDKEIPMGPYEAFQAGIVRDMPMIQGNTKDEGTLFVYSGFNKSITESMMDLTLVLVFGYQDYTSVKTKYPIPHWEANDTRPLMSQLTTDSIFECVNRNVSRYRTSNSKQPNWYYVYDHPPSIADRVYKVKSCWNESCHGCELAFVFHSADAVNYNGSFWNMTAEEYVLSDQMVQYWTNFAHTGDPNKPSGRGILGKRQPAIEWPSYDPSNAYNLHITTPKFYIDKLFDKPICDFWDTLGYTWENKNKFDYH